MASGIKGGKQIQPGYTCSDYRMEMILLALERRLNRPDMEEAEKKDIEAEIERLKAEIGM